MMKTTIKNETGLHARPASLLVCEATKFKSHISIVKNGELYNCKSIMGIMGSGLVKGDEIEIVAEGPDATDAEQKIFEIIESLVD